jgi:hypothetical protein
VLDRGYTYFRERRKGEVYGAGKVRIGPAQTDQDRWRGRHTRWVLSVSYVRARVARGLAVHKNCSRTSKHGKAVRLSSEGDEGRTA